MGTLAPYRNGQALGPSVFITAPGVTPVPAPVAPPAPPPAGTNVPFGETPPASAPAPAFSGSGGPTIATAFIKVFTLTVKMLPVFLVLGGAGYFYKSMFGKMSEEELAAAGIRVKAGSGPQSKTEVMLNQTKNVVAAQTANVSLANQLAESMTNGTSLDKIGDASPAPPPPAAPPKPVAKLSASRPAIPTQAQAAGDPTTLVFTPIHSGLGPPPPPATPAFADWARNARLSGVRLSASTPRALVNGVLFKSGEIVDHGLGITMEGVDPVTKAVIFSEPAGARLGLRF